MAVHVRRYVDIRSDPLGYIERTPLPMEIPPVDVGTEVPATPMDLPWSSVIGRRARRGGASSGGRRVIPPPRKEYTSSRKYGEEARRDRPRRSRSVVVVKPTDMSKTAANLMRRVRESVPKDQVDVKSMFVREAAGFSDGLIERFNL